jgi:hypothetical protein
MSAGLWRRRATGSRCLVAGGSRRRSGRHWELLEELAGDARADGACWRGVGQAWAGQPGKAGTGRIAPASDAGVDVQGWSRAGGTGVGVKAEGQLARREA